MKAIVTGSRKYGIPRPDSDIDLVVFVSPEDIALLKLAAAEPQDAAAEEQYDPEGNGAVLRFGALNLLCVTNYTDYMDWSVGTDTLAKQAPATREQAVRVFSTLREITRRRRGIRGATSRAAEGVAGATDLEF